MRSYPFPDERRGFQDATQMNCFVLYLLAIHLFCVGSCDWLGGFWRIGAGLPQLERRFRRGQKTPKWGFLDPPPFFEKWGGGKRAKKVYDRRRSSACHFMASVGVKSQGGGGAMVPRVVPVGGVPPPRFGNRRGLI